MDCYYCKAKEYCIAAAQPGSMVCLVNRMRYGGTHADDAPPRQVGGFCQYCGQPLREIGMVVDKLTREKMISLHTDALMPGERKGKQIWDTGVTARNMRSGPVTT